MTKLYIFLLLGLLSCSGTHSGPPKSKIKTDIAEAFANQHWDISVEKISGHANNSQMLDRKTYAVTLKATFNKTVYFGYQKSPVGTLEYKIFSNKPDWSMALTIHTSKFNQYIAGSTVTLQVAVDYMPWGDTWQFADKMITSIE